MRKKRKRIEELTNLPNVFRKPQDMKGKWKEKYFKNNNEIVLELGAGKGEYTVNLAKKFNNKNFIAVEIKGPRLWKGATNAIKEKLNNAAFLQILIEEITDYIGENEIDEIWIPFPDPYPKPSKSQKRLISERFINLYKKVLKKDGIIHFKTDSTDLFNFCLDTIKKQKNELLASTYDLYKSEYLDEQTGIRTDFEQKFLDMNIKIKYLRIRIKK